ncbi:MAG: hypothetical protein HRT68_11610 [Flavobacteriaceae bacterium]|nr:hypothetical protein [Flavobacteriaceae bacterium]
MKWNWDNIKLILSILVVFFLFAFANQRNGERQLITDESITFLNDENLFINHHVVNKLLIQKDKHVRNLKKDALALNELENDLNENPMIQKAQVYLAVNGELGVNIEQKKPIARVLANGSFYIDDRGKKMPLSDNFSARVILVTGNVTEKYFSEIRDLATYMQQDEFLNMHFDAIHVRSDGELELSTRTQQYKVLLGTAENIEKKFRNYKAFYQKAKKDKSLIRFNLVNLEFNNQVVCTKKQQDGRQ